MMLEEISVDRVKEVSGCTTEPSDVVFTLRDKVGQAQVQRQTCSSGYTQD
jgi:hypothetical protein